MFHPEAKVYYDGSHYIAIPHTEAKKRKAKEPEELVEVQEKEETKENKPKKKASRSEIFNEAYVESKEMPKQHRKEYLKDTMRPYFKDEKNLEEFVEAKVTNKRRNALQRKVRFIRKAYMNDFNYFATFTYDGKKLDEKAFKRKLRDCLANFQKRKAWRYMGVWEQAPKTKRLHFHCLLHVPKGTMPGEMITVRDYNTKEHKMQESIQNTYFNERFGRSDFEEIGTKALDFTRSLAYILKYIEKTGERIVYSRGLPMYMISDIDDNDVLCYFGIEDKKLILADDFTCYDMGEEIGKINAEIKKQMRTANN